jgi:hypothetical protein
VLVGQCEDCGRCGHHQGVTRGRQVTPESVTPVVQAGIHKTQSINFIALMQFVDRFKQCRRLSVYVPSINTMWRARGVVYSLYNPNN